MLKYKELVALERMDKKQYNMADIAYDERQELKGLFPASSHPAVEPLSGYLVNLAVSPQDLARLGHAVPGYLAEKGARALQFDDVEDGTSCSLLITPAKVIVVPARRDKMPVEAKLPDFIEAMDEWQANLDQHGISVQSDPETLELD